MIRKYAAHLLPGFQMAFLVTLLLAMSGVGNPYVMIGLLFAFLAGTLSTIDYDKK